MNNVDRIKQRLLSSKPVVSEEGMTGFECGVFRSLMELWDAANELEIDHNAPFSSHESAKLMADGVVDLFAEVSRMPRSAQEDGLIAELSSGATNQTLHRHAFYGSVLELVRTAQRAMASRGLRVIDPQSPKEWERLQRRIVMLILDVHEQPTSKAEDEDRTRGGDTP